MMKKLSIALVVAAAAIMGSCNNAAKPELKDDIDTISYAFGLMNSQGVKDYLAHMEVDTTNMDAFVDGLKEAMNDADPKKKAYLNGVAAGLQMAMGMKQMDQFFFPDSSNTVNRRNYIAGFAAGATGKDTLMSFQKAQTYVQQRVEAQQKEMMKKQGMKQPAQPQGAQPEVEIVEAPADGQQQAPAQKPADKPADKEAKKK